MAAGEGFAGGAVGGNFGVEFGEPVLDYVDLGGDGAWVEERDQKAMAVGRDAVGGVVGGASSGGARGKEFAGVADGESACGVCRVYGDGQECAPCR